MTAWLERKREAADLFISHLLASPARSHIAKVLLHGSVAEGTAQPESDVGADEARQTIQLAEELLTVLAAQKG